MSLHFVLIIFRDLSKNRIHDLPSELFGNLNILSYLWVSKRLIYFPCGALGGGGGVGVRIARADFYFWERSGYSSNTF